MAFVSKRQILDGFVIAEEIIHHWKKGNEGGLVVKLDFEKTYDSIDHDFLDDMLLAMGFGSKWRRWIKNCISSPKLSVWSMEARQDSLLWKGDSIKAILYLPSFLMWLQRV
ncbi:hypothetical protein Ddye_028200 [Dipteronia dyeriana]|uniref:Reverse transcriptase domain-containing protein n=1 Tax=Dipteronia dyeriana TaxID=168575 RepID=A0AAD9TRF0_9ROSI|nr:hypothetical protein Ddye_028200 [Dipteronia dyeriana]